MNIKYDSKVDTIYIELAKGVYEGSRKILGVEILDAKKNIPAFNPQKTKLQVQAH